MGEALSIKRHVLETQLITKAWKDPEFREQVIRNPKGMLEQHLGQKLPERVKIFVYGEDANTLHFVVPPAPTDLAELSDEDLEGVAGGTDLLLASAVWTVMGVIAGAAAGTLAATAVANDKLW